MTDHNSNIIYIYDGEHRDIISIDAETGERIDRNKNDIDKLLTWLNEQNRDAVLRKFIIWCAHQTNQQIKPIQNKCLELAENAVNGKVPVNELQQLYEKLEGPAISVDSVGLRQGSLQACGFLITRECVNPNVLEGAKNAVRYHRLCTKMNTSHTINEHETKQIQIDCLLDLMGN